MIITDLQFWSQRLSFPFRRKVSGKVLEGKRLVLDYLKLEDVVMEDCEIVYFGFGPITMNGCSMIRCRFTLSSHAANTMKYLQCIGSIEPGVIQKSFPDVLDKGVPLK